VILAKSGRQQMFGIVMTYSFYYKDKITQGEKPLSIANTFSHLLSVKKGLAKLQTVSIYKNCFNQDEKKCNDVALRGRT